MNIRIEEKENERINGREITAFKVYEYSQGSYIYAGQYSTSGFDASDEQCEDEFLQRC